MYKIKELIEYLPYVYRSEYVSEVLRVCNNQVEKLFQDIADSEEEYKVSTATYSLPWWARLAGIDDNSELDIDTRRSNVMAAMKVQDIVTLDTVRKIAESYSHGECEVIEISDEYRFKIKFVGTKGIPSRLDEIKKIIKKVKPAHLKFEFEFTYMTWDEMEAHALTWDEWDSKHLTWDEFEKYGK